jgi:hypothetical protein
VSDPTATVAILSGSGHDLGQAAPCLPPYRDRRPVRHSPPFQVEHVRRPPPGPNPPPTACQRFASSPRMYAELKLIALQLGRTARLRLGALAFDYLY